MAGISLTDGWAGITTMGVAKLVGRGRGTDSWESLDSVMDSLLR